MKLILLILLSSLLYGQEIFIFSRITSTGSVSPAYYVDATSGNDANDGLTPGTAWQTIAKVNSASLAEGNVIAFKRGETWSEQLVPQQSQVTYNSYGSGALPKINIRLEPPGWADSTNWSLVDATTHAWQLSLPSNVMEFGFVWLDNKLYKAAYFYADDGTNYPFDSTAFDKNDYDTYPRLDQEYRFWEWRTSPANDLFVWTPCLSAADYNPANYYSSIEIPVQANIRDAVSIEDVDSITIDGLDIESGSRGIWVSNSNHNEIKNCNILSGLIGIDFNGQDDDHSLRSDSNLVHDNTITHGQELAEWGYYNWYSDNGLTSGSWRTVSMGVRVYTNCNGNRVYNNTMSNFSNSQFALFNTDATETYYTNNNYFYGNTLRMDSSYLSRAWNMSVDPNGGHMRNNAMVNNTIIDQSEDAHVAGNGSLIALNRFKHVKLMNPSLYGNTGFNGAGQISDITFHDSISVIHNTFYDVGGAGLNIRENIGYLTLASNIFVNVGSNSQSSIFDGVDGGNTYDTLANNILFYTGKTGADVMAIYEGATVTIAALNAGDAHGDYVDGNYQWTGTLSDSINTSTYRLVNTSANNSYRLNQRQIDLLIDIYQSNDVYRKDGELFIDDGVQVMFEIGDGGE